MRSEVERRVHNKTMRLTHSDTHIMTWIAVEPDWDLLLRHLCDARLDKSRDCNSRNRRYSMLLRGSVVEILPKQEIGDPPLLVNEAPRL